MLLKAAIIHRGGRIRKAHEKLTMGFDACVRTQSAELNNFCGQALKLLTASDERSSVFNPSLWLSLLIHFLS